MTSEQKRTSSTTGVSVLVKWRTNGEIRAYFPCNTPRNVNLNYFIGSVEPTRYLKSIEKRAKISPEELDEIVATHLVTPAELRSSDFDSYFTQRRDALVRSQRKPWAKQSSGMSRKAFPKRPPTTSSDRHCSRPRRGT